MFKTIGSQFASKHLSSDKLYELSAGHMCIRIRPFTGNTEFHYLRWSSSLSYDGIHIKIPMELKKISGINKKCFELQAGNTVYLLHPDFKGSPDKVTFTEYTPFSYAPKPTGDFFAEAEKQTTLSVRKDSGQVIDVHMLGTKTTITNVAVSLFAENGRRWAEIRKDKNANKLDKRIAKNAFVEELSGVTFSISLDKVPFVLSNVGLFKSQEIVTWYSAVRDAVIVEDKPEECAICGAQLRSIDSEHHKIQVCNHCKKDLGKNGKINAAATAYKALENAKAVIEAARTM